MDYRGHIHSIFNRINSNLMVPTIRERKRHLLNLKNWINENRQQIIDTLYIDLGKPEPEVELAEIWYVLSEIKLAYDPMFGAGINAVKNLLPDTLQINNGDKTFTMGKAQKSWNFNINTFYCQFIYTL